MHLWLQCHGCFNGFNRFTWFNMGGIVKNDRCLIKTIKTANISLVTDVESVKLTRKSSQTRHQTRRSCACDNRSRRQWRCAGGTRLP